MRLLVVFLGIFLISAPAFAEPVPGDSCAGYPAGAAMHSGGPEHGGKVYLMNCVGGIWAEVTINADPCAEAPIPIGATCRDGTIYAGQHPVLTTVQIFATSAAHENPNVPWNNGLDHGYVSLAPGLTYCTNAEPPGGAGCHEGKSNTAYLASLTSSSVYAPYLAAQYCEELSAHGYNDWYLPSVNELSLLMNNLAKNNLGGFSGVGTGYTTSSAPSMYNIWYGQKSGSMSSLGSKVYPRVARCIRHS